MKTYTDLEQSHKLAEILPLESADMYYFLDPTPAGNIYHLTLQRIDFGIKNLPHYDKGDIPCWSLTALLSVLPRETRLLKSATDDTYHCDCPKSNVDEWFENPVDACVDMIEKLHEQKIL